MRTLVVSDLHLGAASGADLLRRDEMRQALLQALDGVDRLVLLGDVLEMRHGPLRESMEDSAPVFAALGRAMAGREIVLVAGNHDHGLIEPWLASRGGEETPAPLQPAQVIGPGEASPAYERIARWAAPARVLVAYPGMWLRPDVYATHGHYLDSHLTVPTLERLSIGAMSRLLARPPASMRGADDYESVSAPVFAWRDAVARDTHPGAILNGLATVGAWQALGGSGRGRGARRASANGAVGRGDRVRRAIRRRLLVAGFPLAVAALNRAGIGPLRAEVSADELRRAGLRAMGEVVERLGIADGYVVFGHTHRPGPLAGDDEAEWTTPSGVRMVNCGSWTYASVFLRRTASESPYWPGVAVLVEDAGPPRVLRLLQDRTREELRPPRPARAS
jgi:Calcineurin-like phosphoesterase